MNTPDDFKWIGRFLKRYIATIGPHDWPEDPDDMRCFAEGWVGAFRIAHPPITEDEADAARVRLAAYPPAFKNKHLPAVVETVLKFRERDATQALVTALATPPDEARAIARSGSCPECGGNGLARRKGVWADRSWHATASLYCRCPLGRYRLGRDRDDPRAYDDLQAFPNLWDRTLSHPTWSERPASPPSVEGREWSYLQPGEPAPAPIAVKVARDAAMPARKRRAEWLGPIPADLEMPRPVPRVEPPPAPEPVDPPAEELSEDYLPWM